MPRTIEKTVYTFDELSDDAKEKARDWYREGALHDDWYDCTFEDAKRCGALLGIDIERIYFSGFCSQGDGACFEGEYQYRKGWRRALRDEVGGDDLRELEDIGERLQETQRRAFYQITATTRQRGHYMHSGCMAVSVEATTPAGDDICEGFIDIEEDVTDALRLFADWIYTSLEREHDYLTSDESVDEMIEANEYEFDEDGDII